jgi:hypothetical protein
MIERNQPCPCGSGKKYKKCHGAAGASAAPVGATVRGGAAPTDATAASTPAAPGADPADRSSGEVGATAEPFLVHTGRGLEAERSEAERKKHLRRRIQDSELRGTLVYNSGAFFKPPPK